MSNIIFNSVNHNRTLQNQLFITIQDNEKLSFTVKSEAKENTEASVKNFRDKIDKIFKDKNTNVMSSLSLRYSSFTLEKDLSEEIFHHYATAAILNLKLTFKL